MKIKYEKNMVTLNLNKNIWKKYAYFEFKQKYMKNKIKLNMRKIYDT